MMLDAATLYLYPEDEDSIRCPRTRFHGVIIQETLIFTEVKPYISYRNDKLPSGSEYKVRFYFSELVEQRKLIIFERKILRKMFGPVQDENGIWRIRKNHELKELIGNADIVRFIKGRMAWL